MAFTPAEVSTAIQNHGLEEFVETMTYTWNNPTPTVELALGAATYVDGKLGREGGGEDIWFVFSLGGDLYRLSGWYSSYDGSNWEDSTPELVVPEEKIITIYVAV